MEVNDGLIIERKDLTTTHEEADAIMVQQAYKSALDSATKSICVVCDHTDVFILLVYFYDKLGLDVHAGSTLGTVEHLKPGKQHHHYVVCHPHIKHFQEMLNVLIFSLQYGYLQCPQMLPTWTPLNRGGSKKK